MLVWRTASRAALAAVVAARAQTSLRQQEVILRAVGGTDTIRAESTRAISVLGAACSDYRLHVPHARVLAPASPVGPPEVRAFEAEPRQALGSCRAAGGKWSLQDVSLRQVRHLAISRTLIGWRFDLFDGWFVHLYLWLCFDDLIIQVGDDIVSDSVLYRLGRLGGCLLLRRHTSNREKQDQECAKLHVFQIY